MTQIKNEYKSINKLNFKFVSTKINFSFHNKKFSKFFPTVIIFVCIS